MARKGRLDRGLMQKRDASSKIVWFVRLYHESMERRFGSFSTKTAARDFYEKAKQEQKTGRFFPERYQHGGYELVEDMIDRYLLTISTKKPMTQFAERFLPNGGKVISRASDSIRSRSELWRRRDRRCWPPWCWRRRRRGT
jgi:hypothetical protein